MISRQRVFFPAAMLLVLGAADMAQAACGWYAISACSRDRRGAERAADRYGGYVIDTDEFRNFAGGYWCAVVGPKTKDAAEITAERMQDRGAEDAYIKHSC